MNHARIRCRSFSVGVSRSESKNRERRLTSSLFIACRDVCDRDTLNVSSVSEMET